MKKLLFVLLCACTLNAVAKPTNEDTILQLVEPFLLLGYAEAFNTLEEGDTPVNNACAYAMAQKLGTPAAVKHTMHLLEDKGLGKKVDALTRFLAQDFEQGEYAKNKAEFDRLLQANQNEKAEQLWESYHQKTVERMPKESAITTKVILKIVGEIDGDALDTLVSREEFVKEMHKNPACVSLFKAE
jgi:hypothetical protein